MLGVLWGCGRVCTSLFLACLCGLMRGRVESLVLRALGFPPLSNSFSFPGPPGGSGSGLIRVREWLRAGFSFPVLFPDPL